MVAQLELTFFQTCIKIHDSCKTIFPLDNLRFNYSSQYSEFHLQVYSYFKIIKFKLLYLITVEAQCACPCWTFLKYK